MRIVLCSVAYSTNKNVLCFWGLLGACSDKSWSSAQFKLYSISGLSFAVFFQASCVKVFGKGLHGVLVALPLFTYADPEEKFGKTLEITDGQHFATLLQAEASTAHLHTLAFTWSFHNKFPVFCSTAMQQVPVLEPCQLVCKDSPMQPQFTVPWPDMIWDSVAGVFPNMLLKKLATWHPLTSLDIPWPSGTQWQQ